MTEKYRIKLDKECWNISYAHITHAVLIYYEIQPDYWAHVYVESEKPSYKICPSRILSVY